MKNELNRHIRPFVSLMESKGYRGLFMLCSADDHPADQSGTLTHCLEMHIWDSSTRSMPPPKFSLITFAEYIDDQDYKECFFNARLDDHTGFKIDQMTIHSRNPDIDEVLRFTNNNEVPGSHAITGRYRKLKTWEAMMKEGFKWRRR